MKCLEKKPSRRYPTAAELAADLERFLKHEPIQARNAGPVRRAFRSARRHLWRTAALTVGLMLGIAAIEGALWWAWQRAALARQVERDLSEAARLTGQSAWSGARVALARASDRLGPSAPADLRGRVTWARRDLALRVRLDGIRVKHGLLEAVEDHVDPSSGRRRREAQADRDYESAFREAGITAFREDVRRAGVKVASSPWKRVLLEALDDWLAVARDPPRRAWLAGVARAADPDAWRDRVRDPTADADPARLEELARTADVLTQPPSVLVALGKRWFVRGGDAVDFLRRVQAAHPGEFWTSYTLGQVLAERGHWQDSGAAFQNAMADRPESAAPQNNLGVILEVLNRADRAIERLREALRLDPESAAAHNNLGLALQIKGAWPDATAEYEAALHFDPYSVAAHKNLGEIQALSAHPDQAIGHYKQALGLDSEFAPAHFWLALTLPGWQRVAEVVTRSNDVLRTRPDDPRANRDSGVARAVALWDLQGARTLEPRWALDHACQKSRGSDRDELEEPLEHLQAAVRCDPKLGQAHGAIGLMRLARGRLGEARAATRRGLELLSRASEHRPYLIRQLQHIDQLLELEPLVPAVLEGTARQAGVEKLILLGDLCRLTARYDAAAQLYEQALAAPDVKAAFDKLGHDLRYNAACAAALAGSASPDLPRGERWRAQARSWLRLELAAGERNLAANVGQYVEPAVGRWRLDPALAGIRTPASLEKLPAEERQECQALWNDVDALLDRIGGIHTSGAD
jgi:serine/threonine-protein kinase